MQFREQFLKEDRQYLKSIATISKVKGFDLEEEGTEPITDIHKEVGMLKAQMAIVPALQNSLDSLQIDIKRSKYDKLDLQIEVKEVQVQNNEIIRRLNKIEPKIDEL